MNKNANFSAFKDLKTSNSNLEKFLDDKLQVNEDEFDEENFGLDSKRFQFDCRKNNPLSLLTSRIVDSFKKTMKDYNYQAQIIRRELTTPHEGKVIQFSKGVANDGLDNVENDLIVSFNDIIVSPDKVNYQIIERLGKRKGD